MRQFVQLLLVHTDVDVTCRMHQYVHQFRITHGRQRFMRQCVHLHCLLTLMVHTSASTGDVNAGMCTYMC